MNLLFPVKLTKSITALKVFSAIIVLSVLFQVSYSQSKGLNRSRYEDVIKNIKSEVEKNYFDKEFKKINIAEKAKLSIEMIKKAESEPEMISIVANFLIEFDDSHLYYIPPIRVSDTDYGWEMMMVGDKCFVTEVSAGSDAEKQGLKVGDEVLIVEGYTPTRENLWKINYYYRTLISYPALNVIVGKPNGKKIQYVLQAKVTKGRKVFGVTNDDWKIFDWRLEKLERNQDRHLFIKTAEKVYIWKMPSFNISPEKVDDIFGKLKNDDSLIIDLRGNGGGRVDMEMRLTSNVFSEDILIGTRHDRKETKDVIAKTRGKNSFKGKLIVLIDSDSGSASEVFSKVVQLEKRGTVIGDQSAGMVMESRISTHKDSADFYSIYGLSVTVANLIMKDGKSLEKIGVTPDEILLPTAQDLAGNRDPILARAFEKLGFKISPEDAGKIIKKD